MRWEHCQWLLIQMTAVFPPPGKQQNSGKQQNLIFIIESKGLALFKSYKKQNTHSHLTIISIQEI